MLHLPDLFETLDKEQVPYFLIKTDETPYAVEDFPNKYPVGKDLDIITGKDFYNEVINAALRFASRVEGFERKTHRTPDNFRFRFEENGKLHYQIDITCKVDLVSKVFIDRCLLDRVKRDEGYYVVPTSHELIFRCYEAAVKPHKQHHKDFYRKHRDKRDDYLFSLTKLRSVADSLE